MTVIIKELFPNVFQFRVPLPHNPLGHLNSYMIRSVERNLLIDTGLNFPESFQSIRADLSQAGVEIEQLTDILLTHFHVDHVGLIRCFREAAKHVRLSIHCVEAELSKVISGKFEQYKENMKSFVRIHGAPSSIAVRLERFHPAFFAPAAYQELAETAVPLEDGQEVSVGNYNFQVLWTPGHSPGHICLYEPALRVLFSGDLLLPTITPHIAQFAENMDPLTDYLKSLKKVECLDVRVVLPAHEESFTNSLERIGQLRDHHKERLTKIWGSLKVESLTAYTLASRMHWNVDYKTWDEFPLFQKYLALGETVAHLNFLEKRGFARRARVGQVFFYSATKDGNQVNLFSPDSF